MLEDYNNTWETIKQFGIDCGAIGNVDVAKSVIKKLEEFGYRLGFPEEDIGYYRFVFVTREGHIHMYGHPGYQEEEITVDDFFQIVGTQEDFECQDLSELYEWIPVGAVYE